MTRVAVLTPPGAGAIATIEVSGPSAWQLAQQLFRPAGKPLPESPELHRFWFGTLGDGVGDEVILAVTGKDTLEIHCHGGRRGVRWVVEQFFSRGCQEAAGELTPKGSVLSLLLRATTLRTASILLDQLHCAFEKAVARIVELLPVDPSEAGRLLRELALYSHVGRHLVDPWKVVVAGPPNVGKSSLVNALAGFQRAVVSEVAGTTRDAVRVPVAFDGWPVELIDTAGLRDAEGLEAEGIERAKGVLSEADLVIWVMDGADPHLMRPDDPDSPRLLVVVNKSDLPFAWNVDDAPGSQRVSTVTGSGIQELVVEIARRLVPDPPPPGAAVPFTPRLAELIEAAHAALDEGCLDKAARLLRDCLVAV